jgi:hypothetical protein
MLVRAEYESATGKTRALPAAWLNRTLSKREPSILRSPYFNCVVR